TVLAALLAASFLLLDPLVELGLLVGGEDVAHVGVELRPELRHLGLDRLAIAALHVLAELLRVVALGVLERLDLRHLVVGEREDRLQLIRHALTLAALTALPPLTLTVRVRSRGRLRAAAVRIRSRRV